MRQALLKLSLLAGLEKEGIPRCEGNVFSLVPVSVSGVGEGGVDYIYIYIGDHRRCTKQKNKEK